jgi:hypothetical protein
MSQQELRGMGIVDELKFLDKKNGQSFFNDTTRMIVRQIRKID